MRTLSLLALFILTAADGRAESITGVVRCRTQMVTNAVVYLGIGNGRTTPTNLPPAVLTQAHGEFVPRIQVARSGAALVLRNNDPTLHVVRIEILNVTNAPTSLLTEAMPYAGYEKQFTLEHFREPKLLKIAAGNGEDAVAYMAVLPHGWAAVTDEQGRFTIDAVPAGNYKLFIWHETLGTLTRDVRAGAQVDVEIPSGAKGE